MINCSFQPSKNEWRLFPAWLIATLLRIVTWLIFRLKIYNRENLFQAGPTIFVARHRSYWDIVCIIVAMGASLTCQTKYVAREGIGLLQCFPFLKGFSILINPRRPQRSSLRKMIATLQSGKNLVIFPEGTTLPDKKKYHRGLIFLVKGAQAATTQSIPITLLDIQASGAYGKPKGKWWRYLLGQARVTLTIKDSFFLKDLKIPNCSSKKEKSSLLIEKVLE